MHTTYEWKEPERPKDIVEELREADLKNKQLLEGAMVIHIDGYETQSLLERAALEIEKLRRVLNITEN